ncbi:hypothetical protein SPBR_00844 [Sporothrix brasiliensis 5110]|uniref:DUF7136 domain-containing protein n=1 Tax=Sporothrix brasiliensis 5110 TaxID=1398154 RepID=A0A0C2IMH7_9PEZI|nr:uncharacterized protein SPBR_00844 [Sporothrix brasiliensis 5110]KIH90246.1 hypothetical protein SPBR_00844 [Sporothrix brasiliensis 5110]
MRFSPISISPVMLFAVLTGLAGLVGTAQASVSNRTVQPVQPAQPVDITLAYPRSEAYNTLGRIPIVFSISNPQYAIWLNPRIDFAIGKYGGDYPFEGQCPVYADTRNFTVDLSRVNLTDPATPDPLYVYAFWECLDYEVGEWYFSWTVRTGRAPDNATDFQYNNSVTDTGGFVFATVHSGGRTMDLVENTSNTSCDSVPYEHDFLVAAIAEGSCNGSITDWPGCAVVANDTGASIAAAVPPPPSSSICGGSISASIAETINNTPRFMGTCPVLPIAHIDCPPSLTVQDMGTAALPSATQPGSKSGAVPRMPLDVLGTMAVAVVAVALREAV